jgi:hypothetical protein
MSNSMGGAKTRPVPCSPVPTPIEELERTREIPAAPDKADATNTDASSAAPAQVVPTEETVPVQSCIERSLLHEILRRESAEKDK